MIAPGLNYIGMKGQNVYKNNERANIIIKKPAFIYPVGGCKGDVHIIITLLVADRMISSLRMGDDQQTRSCAIHVNYASPYQSHFTTFL